MVLAVGPRAGSKVAQVKLLVRIDARTIARDLAALVQQHAGAQADADYAVKQQQRFDAMLLERSVSQAQADQARALAYAARAKASALAEQIAALRVQLVCAEIRAPRGAVVAERLVGVGDTVAPGTPIYCLTAGSGALVRVALAASQLALCGGGAADPEATRDTTTAAPAQNRAWPDRTTDHARRCPATVPPARRRPPMRSTT